MESHKRSTSRKPDKKSKPSSSIPYGLFLMCHDMMDDRGNPVIDRNTDKPRKRKDLTYLLGSSTWEYHRSLMMSVLEVLPEYIVHFPFINPRSEITYESSPFVAIKAIDQFENDSDPNTWQLINYHRKLSRSFGPHSPSPQAPFRHRLTGEVSIIETDFTRTYEVIRSSGIGKCVSIDPNNFVYEPQVCLSTKQDLVMHKMSHLATTRKGKDKFIRILDKVSEQEGWLIIKRGPFIYHIVPHRLEAADRSPTNLYIVLEPTTPFTGLMTAINVHYLVTCGGNWTAPVYFLMRKSTL